MPRNHGSPLAGPNTLVAIELSDDPLPQSEPGVSNHAEISLHESNHVDQNCLGEVHTVHNNASNRYMPWVFDQNGIGILPRSLSWIWVLVYMSAFVVWGLITSVNLFRLFSEQASLTGFSYGTSILNFQYSIPLIFGVNVLMAPSRSSMNQAPRWWMALLAAGSVALLYGILDLDRTINGIISVHERGVIVVQTSFQAGLLPKSLYACKARVTPQQASLFTADIYRSHFEFYRSLNDTHVTPEGCDSFPAWPDCIYFDMEKNFNIQSNATLCNSGFSGNTDIYGLGIRCGVYFQWVSSLLANNFLLPTRNEVQKMYLFVSLATSLAVLILSASESCTFSIEIEILYWLYWGGNICVFASAPCPVKLGTVSKWVKMDWTGAILFVSHWMMAYHAFWFYSRAYDREFARMPCGTYHFFFAPVLDPSAVFWMFKDMMRLLVGPFSLPVLTAFPLVAILLIPEAKYTIQSSIVYRAFVSGRGAAELERPGTLESDALPSRERKIYTSFKQAYRTLRKLCYLPKQNRGGIYLVTPATAGERRSLRIRWATTGIAACILSMTAIELTLKWNKVEGVYSISSTGQYIPLTIGVASFISVCWSVVKQESERPRLAEHNQAVSEEDEQYELQGLASTVSHASAEPNDEFFMSGGLPALGVDDEADIAEAGIPISI